MRPLLISIALLFATSASATLTLTLQSGTETEVAIGPNDCDDVLTVNFTVTTSLVCETLRVWATTATSCPDVAVDGDLVIGSRSVEELTAQPSGSMTFDVRDLPFFRGDNACGVRGIEATQRICGGYKGVSNQFGDCGNTTVTKVSSPPTIRYDGKPPPTPSITGVSGRDRALRVTVTAPEAVLVRYQLREADSGAEFREVTTHSGESQTGEIKGLENGTTYEVRVVSEDAAGNESDPSNVESGTTVETFGFFASYCNAGGDCDGGCGAAAGGPTLLGLLSLALMLRRRKS